MLRTITILLLGALTVAALTHQRNLAAYLLTALLLLVALGPTNPRTPHPQ